MTSFTVDPSNESTRTHSRRSGDISLAERLDDIEETLEGIFARVAPLPTLEYRLAFLERIVYGLLALMAAQVITLIVGVIVWALRQ